MRPLEPFQANYVEQIPGPASSESTEAPVLSRTIKEVPARVWASYSVYEELHAPTASSLNRLEFYRETAEKELNENCGSQGLILLMKHKARLHFLGISLEIQTAII